MKKNKSIGIEVKSPKQKCDDQFCPFHGNLKLRGQTFVGTVISSKMQKSAVVQWVTSHYIPKYEIAEDLYQKLMGLKRWRAIDVSLPNLLPNVKYIYPAPFIEEPYESQIMNKTKKKHANEFYEFK